MMDCIIGIDIGTTNIKSVTIDSAGKILSTHELPNETLSSQPGYSEQDPDKIVGLVISLLQQAVEAVRTSHQLKYISFSAAMHGMMAVDKTGKSLTPLMTWADTRSAGIAAKLRLSPNGLEIYQHTGTPVHPMSPLCKIAWLKMEQPSIFQQSFKFISIKEYIFFRLFNEFVIDHSIASATGLFDIEKKEWNPTALAFAGITKNQLSKPVPVDYIFDKPDKKIFPLNIPAATGFIIGGSDGCLANIGSGALDENAVALTIGTSGAVRKITKKKKTLSAQTIFEYLLDDEHYVLGGAINNGGIALNWFAKNFYSTDADLDTILNEAAHTQAGSEGLIFLPYVFGERAPVWDAEASGAFVGIKGIHTKPHFARAVIEGICFSLLQILELLDEEKSTKVIYISGGFTHSPFWTQTLANILNKELKIAKQHADASALGGAFIGLKLMGEISEWQDAKKYFDAFETISPDNSMQETYQKNYAIYKTLYSKLKLT